MTEAEWLTATDPGPMLAFLRGKASDRKLRLFACACARRVLDLLAAQRDSGKTIEFAERFADGLATRNELHGQAWGKSGDAFSVVLWNAQEAAENAAEAAAGRVAHAAALAADARTYGAWDAAFKSAYKQDLQGLSEALTRADAAVPAEWVAMRETARRREQEQQALLIQDIQGNPFRRVTADPRWFTADVLALARAIYDDRAVDRLPLLADALMDAGCADADILAHCRSAGPHVRGCWVVDLALGKM
jgi:hypothetical protein